MTADTGLLETRRRSLQFRTEFENSDGVSADVSNSYELLQEPFEIAPGVILPVGGYDFTDVQVSYTFGQHRRASGAFSREIRRKNEYAYITRIPISVGGGGPAGIFRVSAAATLVGLEVPDSGMNLEIKPYGIGGVSTDLDTEPPVRNEGDGDVGVDAKLGLTRSLTADLTYNTDFAQVEVDEQQVNLTRFSLFFPEKRDFFLEGRGIFNFARGGLSRIGGGGGSRRGGGRGSFGGGDVPTIFFSRRIGLQDGAVVPILGGGRVTGKVGAFDVGR